jgi:DNA-binding beta-propeller fold protein YncE
LICTGYWSTAQIINTYAGNGTAGYSGDGGPATAAEIGEPCGVAVDGLGNVYLSNYSLGYISKITPSGIISTIAGTGFTGYSGVMAALLRRPN